jgi:hypothetical protein
MSKKATIVTPITTGIDARIRRAIKAMPTVLGPICDKPVSVTSALCGRIPDPRLISLG